MGFQNMKWDLKFGAPSGEIGMTSLPVIEKRPISPKPLQVGVSFCTWFLTVSMPSIGLLTYQHNKVIKHCLGNKTANINPKNCKFKT